MSSLTLPNFRIRIKFKCQNNFVGEIVTTLNCTALICHYLEKDELVDCYWVGEPGRGTVLASDGPICEFSDKYPKWCQTVDKARDEFCNSSSIVL